MERFALLLERLLFSPQRNVKLALIEDYVRHTPDPDRGWAVAALTGTLDLPHAKPALIRDLVRTRTDDELFALSYDFVGDLAETAALMWPEAQHAGAGAAPDPTQPGPTQPGPTQPGPAQPGPAGPGLAQVVEGLRTAARSAVPELLAGWLDRLDADGRWALLKLITGGLRVGVSARLAKTALARMGGIEVAQIEELWHALDPPYEPLFRWLEGRGEKPRTDARPVFRPLMLAAPLEEADRTALDPAAFVAEWKWDGIRVQLVAQEGEARLYSRSGDDISGSFPEIVASIASLAVDRLVLDGELLVVREGVVAGFADLQQRLGRKNPGAALRTAHPAFVHLYDILILNETDLRDRPFVARRAALEAFVAGHAPASMDLSPLLAFSDMEDLARLRDASAGSEREGLMLKRRDSIYVAGRPRGLWYKWKRDPRLVDCVLMYAQRGHGKRSSFYSDFTFGCWSGTADSGDGAAGRLVPVGKAYFGFTDVELAELDRFVRNHTTARFGPVREVEKSLVLEIAFDAVQASTRHKSGVALRFPRIHRIRWDKPAGEADRLAVLEAMIEGGAGPGRAAGEAGDRPPPENENRKRTRIGGERA